MNIELDSIPLIWTEMDPAGGISEVRNVSNINTSDKRSMVEHEIPGMEGSVFQNFGRSPVRISFDGSLQGKTAKNNLEIIRSKFKQGIPLPFYSDISGAADVTKVLIEDLRIEDAAGMMNRYKYSIALTEYKEPPPEPVTPPAQDEEAENWVEEAATETVESINCLTGKVLDSEDNPKSGVPVFARSYEGEYQGKTNDEGMYRIENLPPGKYKITVDSEEYQGIEEVVTIGKGGEEVPPEEEPAEEETTTESTEEETTTESSEEETTAEPTEEETTTESTEEETTTESSEEETTAEPTEEETTTESTEEETTAEPTEEETTAESTEEETTTESTEEETTAEPTEEETTAESTEEETTTESTEEETTTESTEEETTTESTEEETTEESTEEETTEESTEEKTTEESTEEKTK